MDSSESMRASSWLNKWTQRRWNSGSNTNTRTKVGAEEGAVEGLKVGSIDGLEVGAGDGAVIIEELAEGKETAVQHLV